MALTRTGYANFAAFPVTGASNIIYVDLSNGNEYLWVNSAYAAYTGTLAGVRTAYQDITWFNANPNFLLGKGQRVDLLQTGTYKLGDGTTLLSVLSWLGSGVTTTLVTEQFTIAGSSQNLGNIPVKTYGYYIDGQKAKVGGRIVSIVGTLVTFDSDYTGSDFEAVYEY